MPFIKSPINDYRNNTPQDKAWIKADKRLADRDRKENITYDLTEIEIEGCRNFVTEIQKYYEAGDEVGYKRALRAFERHLRELPRSGQRKNNETSANSIGRST